MNGDPKEYGLGVLLVHGIGTQPCGETLVRWGDVLIKCIQRATRDRVRTRIAAAGRTWDTALENPTTAVLKLRSTTHQEQPWLLMDGWWADVFVSPSYRELVSWSVRAIPWAIAIHVGQRFWNTAGREKFSRNLASIGIATLQLLIGLALAPLLIILLALALVLGLLPIPKVRSFVLAVQGTLVSSMGDCLAFVESPMRAALIRTRVLNRLNWLKERCDHTVIIAHSQGAAVVLDALGAISEPTTKDRPAAEPDLTKPEIAPNTLITFGAGTNQLTSLKSLSAGLPNAINPVITVIGALYALGGIVAWLFVAAFSHRITGKEIVLSITIVALIGAVFGGIAAGTGPFVDWITKRISTLEKYEPWIFVVVFVGVITGEIFLVSKISIPFEWARVMLPLGFALVTGIFAILSKKTKADVTLVNLPPEVKQWYDFYASADPVPNGPTGILDSEAATERFKSIRISNLGSFFGDHTAYWDNLDGFVLPVVRACAQTAHSSWRAELPRELPKTNERSKWRVGYLQLARWTVYFSSFVVGCSFWVHHGAQVPVPFKLPSWVPALGVTTIQLAVCAAGTVIFAWCAFGIVRLIWFRWARAEQQLVLAHQPVKSTGFWQLVGIGFVIWPIIGFALLAAANQFPHLEHINSLENIIWLIILLALVSASSCVLIDRGPKIPEPDPS
jgi:hypothetical protein